MKRAWQLYIAHILLFLIFTAQVARAARKFDNPMYKDEFNVANFFQHPDVLIGKALTLQYKPVNLDVLPLYIALLLISPVVLWCLVRRPNVTLAASAIFYVFARWFDWNLPSYPAGATWYFNPFAWQLLFVFAAWCGLGNVSKLASLIQSRVMFWVCVAWLAFAFVIVMTWHLPMVDALIPKWLIKAIYPIDKTDLDMLRLTHFLALAVIVVRNVPKTWSVLSSPIVRPVILCGQNSLAIFCLGVFLSFSAHWLLIQFSQGVFEQLFVSFLGIAIMVGAARLLNWYKTVPDLFEAAEIVERAPAE